MKSALNKSEVEINRSDIYSPDLKKKTYVVLEPTKIWLWVPSGPEVKMAALAKDGSKFLLSPAYTDCDCCYEAQERLCS